jgi:multisubunit Na+/H+ antiporter MnhG subunit
MRQPSVFILAGGVAILAIGFTYAAINHRPETKVLAGGIGVIVIASIFDVMGPNAARFGAALVSLALVAVLLAEGPVVAQALAKAQKG